MTLATLACLSCFGQVLPPIQQPILVTIVASTPAKLKAMEKVSVERMKEEAPKLGFTYTLRKHTAIAIERSLFDEEANQLQRRIDAVFAGGKLQSQVDLDELPPAEREAIMAAFYATGYRGPIDKALDVPGASVKLGHSATITLDVKGKKTQTIVPLGGRLGEKEKLIPGLSAKQYRAEENKDLYERRRALAERFKDVLPRPLTVVTLGGGSLLDTASERDAAMKELSRELEEAKRRVEKRTLERVREALRRAGDPLATLLGGAADGKSLDDTTKTALLDALMRSGFHGNRAELLKQIESGKVSLSTPSRTLAFVMKGEPANQGIGVVFRSVGF